MATVPVTSENFDAVTNSEGVTVLDFWAPWCAPCKQFSPIFERVSGNYDDVADVTFGTVNTDDNQDLAERFGIQTIPTLVVFKGGEPVYQEVGGLNELSLDTLVRMIRG